MIDIQLIRNRPDEVREAMRRRNEDAPLDRIAELDADRRTAIVEADELRARRNEVSRQIGQTRERPQELIDEMRQVSARIRTLEETIRTLESEVNALLLSIPNMPLEDVPPGADESANVVKYIKGEAPHFDFEPLPHWELGERLGIIDLSARRENRRLPLLRAQGQGRSPSARSHRLDARHPHPRTRLRGALPAQHRHQGVRDRQQQPAQIRPTPCTATTRTTYGCCPPLRWR